MIKSELENRVKAISEAAIKLRSLKRPVLIAIDGRCASGKTTLASALQKELGCTVFHMDSFFLRPEQRTVERLSKAGENVDHERFLEEVLMPLKKGEKTVIYRPFDCTDMRLSEAVQVNIGDICVIEGSYSCHSELWEYYDLRVFLDVDKDEQIRRIIRRNGEDRVGDFREKWIPLEEKYFSEYDIEGRCELTF